MMTSPHPATHDYNDPEEMDCRQGLSAPDKQLTSGGLGGMSCQGAQIDSSCSVCARSSAADHARLSGKAPPCDFPPPSSWRLSFSCGLLPSPPWPVSVSLATWNTFRSNCPSSNVITIPVTHTHDIHTWLRRSSSFSRVTWAQVWGWVA